MKSDDEQACLRATQIAAWETAAEGEETIAVCEYAGARRFLGVPSGGRRGSSPLIPSNAGRCVHACVATVNGARCVCFLDSRGGARADKPATVEHTEAAEGGWGV